MLAGSGGYGLIAQTGDLVGRQKAGKTFLSLEAAETLLPPVLAGEGVELQLACLSSAGRLLTFALSELKHQPKGGRGLTLIDLSASDRLISVAVFAQALRVQGNGRGGKPKEEALKGANLASFAGKRARKGREIDAFPKALKLLAL